ncbi:hypothetical protein PIB30_032673 [Stylosanthes scabra]|uniref:Uncharacterized protein n=1 Tax=Stylosanthes scabra TaxID=79078 RepID=A0ABU6Y9G7_9FABA|nr:hypothetical protein [Stylosanthes scabra]
MWSEASQLQLMTGTLQRRRRRTAPPRLTPQTEDWISFPQHKGPKCRRKAQGKLKRTREARRIDKKPKKSPTQRRPRVRALKMARPHPPFLNMEVSVGGAPAQPRWCARATPFCNAQHKDLARLRDGGGAPARRRQNSLK